MAASHDDDDGEASMSPPPFLTPWSCDESLHYQRHGIVGSSSFFTSPRGLRLFTRTFLPASSPPSACICMVHGYSNDTSWTFQNIAIRLAKMGFAAFAMDIEGHGRSQGLKGYVANLDLVSQDFTAFFATQKSDNRFRHLPFYLLGESLGGGICLLIHLSSPDAFDGAILLSPMCKISDNLKPPWPLPQLLSLFSFFAPTWAIVPVKDHRKFSFRDPAKFELSQRNPNRYTGKPRLGTAREMVRVTEYLGNRLEDVSLPFMVCHGEKDVVTDPEVSKALFHKAKSSDKTLKLYEGMWHALLAGEPDEDVDRIFLDIETWLRERIGKKTSRDLSGG